MTTPSRPRLGFLGLGWIGRNRLEAVVSSGAADIVAVSDCSEEAIHQCIKIVAPHLPSVVAFDKLLQLDLDGVVIATPSALHAEQARLAMQSGLSVFCQKPLGRNYQETAGLIAEAQRLDRRLQLDLSYRHLRGLLQMRNLVQSGELGDIVATDLIFHNAYGPDKPWFYKASLSGGGCVLDLGIHLVDAVQWIYGQPIVEVRSHLSHAGKPLIQPCENVEDYASAQLRFDSGAVGNLACSWRLHAGQDAVIEIAFYGTQGAVRMTNIDGSFHEFRTERLTRTDRTILIENESDWSSGAILEWVHKLSVSRSYDSDIEMQMTNSRIIDEIYAQAWR